MAAGKVILQCRGKLYRSGKVSRDVEKMGKQGEDLVWGRRRRKKAWAWRMWMRKGTREGDEMGLGVAQKGVGRGEIKEVGTGRRGAPAGQGRASQPG